MTDEKPAVMSAAIAAATPVIHKLMCLFCSEPSLRAEPPCHRQPDELDQAAARMILEAAAPHMAYAAGLAAGGRLAALEKLAAEILDSYTKTSDGWRGRVGQVQIARWRVRLDGPGADQDGGSR